ncbi:MAG: hypothetical protein HYZ20_15170 [Burkholderiales bacterium]|nr:hypothetical protein [Burkholderiales bacterium]
MLLVDSITQLGAGDAGAVVVSGSHGGTSSARYALAQPLALAVFNDAGIGKDEAGVAALAMLQASGRAAATVAHTSARIGDARDAFEHGIVSRVNAAAAALGIAPGQALRAALRQWLGDACAGSAANDRGGEAARGG